MLEKPLCDEILSRIRTGGLTVTYWDGENTGIRHPVVHAPEIARQACGESLELAVGEGYVNGEIEVSGDLAELSRLAPTSARALRQRSHVQGVARVCELPHVWRMQPR
jgi:hypothetical protein